VTVPKD